MEIGGPADELHAEHQEALQDMRGLRLFAGLRDADRQMLKISLLPHASAAAAAEYPRILVP